MRKIHVLKAIIDFLWVTLIIGFILVLFIFVAFLLNVNWISPKFTINGSEYQSMLLGKKLYLLLYFLVNGILLIYSLNLFRNIIDLFKHTQIFDNVVILNFQRIGNILVFLAPFNLVYTFIYEIIMTTEKGGKIIISTPWTLFVFLGFGLFFMILSEVFKIAKATKQENDLTI